MTSKKDARTRAISITTILVLTMGSVGCSGPIGKAETTIAHALIDPDSAKWRDVKILEHRTSDGGTISTVCGEINSRNRLGGMAGFSSFSYVFRHRYPNTIPPRTRLVIPEGVYSIDEGIDSIRNSMISGYDDRGWATMYAICKASAIPLPSGLVDYSWVNPCDQVIDADSGGIGSFSWMASHVIQKFPNLPRKKICEIIVDQRSNLYDRKSFASIIDDPTKCDEEKPSCLYNENDKVTENVYNEALRWTNVADLVDENKKYYHNR